MTRGPGWTCPRVWSSNWSPIRRDDDQGPHVESGIIGADNRVVRRNNTEYPWSMVAYLPLGNSYRGTATMIGPSTALTAAHVVHKGTNWLTLPGVDVFDFIRLFSAL